MLSLVTILILLLILLYLSWKDLIWGVSFLVFLLPCYLLRLEVFNIPTTMLELGIYVIFLIYLWRLYQKKASFKWNQFFTLALVLLVVVFLNAVFISENKIASLGLWKGWFLDPILLMVVVVGILRKKAQLEMMRTGFLFLVGLLGSVALVQFIFGAIDTPDGRVSAFFTSANYLAMILWPSLLVVLINTFKNRKLIWWEAIFWLVGIVALVLTASYIGIFSFILGLVVYGFILYAKELKRMLWIGLTLVMLVSVFLATQVGSERFRNMIDLSERSSVTVRLEVWQIDWEMIADNTIFGIGLGNYEQKYLEYAPRLFHPPMEWRMLHAHNLFLHTWVELGLIGFLVFMAILIGWWQLLVRTIKSKVNYYWALASLVILLGWIVGGMLDTPYYKNDFSVLFWLLLGISMVAMYRSLYDSGGND